MKNFCTTILTLLMILAAEAQTPYFQQYYLMKKNETVQVNTIFQDKEGLIWFGTSKGLFNFDGRNYRRISTADSLPDNVVTAITQDSSGTIWTGHRNGNVALIRNGRVGKFTPQEGTPAAEISRMMFDRRGNLWLSTLNDGLYYYRNQRMYRVDEAEGMPDLFVYDIAEDARGNIWAGTDGGAVVCTLNDTGVSVKVINTSNGAPDNIIRKIRINDGIVWMSTEDAGITLYDPERKQFSPLMKDRKFKTASDFLVTEKQVWISSTDDEILVINRHTHEVRTYSPGLSAITSLHRDPEGNIWTGAKSGVMRTHGNEVELIEHINGLTDLNVLAVTTDTGGDIWFSTREGLFILKKGEKGVFTPQRQLTGTGFGKSVIISLHASDDGYIWAGLFGDGLLRINPRTNQVRLLNRELRNGNVLNITSRDNVVWIATLGGGTRVVSDGEKLQVTNYSSADGLISDYIYQVYIDSRGRAWFATDGKGAGMLDEKGFHHIMEGLPSGVVYGFAEDRNGIIWANVQANGLYQLDGEKFKGPPKGIIFRDNEIASLAADSNGTLVLIHQSGIDLYDPAENRIKYLGEEVGTGNRKANLNSFAKDKSGRLYFGTESGIISYANTNQEEFTSPRPLLRKLRIFDKPVDFTSSSRLDYDENNLTLEYQAIWYQNPGNVNYRYRIDSYDRDWIYTRDNQVTYSRLPPGNYTFRLQASDGEHFDTSAEATFRFVITPPFWKTIPFYLIVAFTLITLGYGLLRYRERRLYRAKLLLEAKVNARTEEIRRKNLEIQARNDEILTQNEEIQSQAEEIKGINENLEQLVRDRTEQVLRKSKALEEYAFINAHKLRAPVASILGLINLLEKTKLDTDGVEINEHLKKSAEELDSIVYTITKTVEKGID